MSGILDKIKAAAGMEEQQVYPRVIFDQIKSVFCMHGYGCLNLVLQFHR